MKSILIKDTTREEREQIIKESLDCGSVSLLGYIGEHHIIAAVFGQIVPDHAGTLHCKFAAAVGVFNSPVGVGIRRCVFHIGFGTLAAANERSVLIGQRIIPLNMCKCTVTPMNDGMKFRIGNMY